MPALSRAGKESCKSGSRRIAVRPALAEPPKEEHDGNTSPYVGEVALYYPESLPKTPENEIDLAIAQLKQQSNLPAGLRRLESAIDRKHPQRSEPYFEMAEASVKDAAKLLEVSRPALSNLLNGNADLSSEMASRFGADPEKLLKIQAEFRPASASLYDSKAACRRLCASVREDHSQGHRKLG